MIEDALPSFLVERLSLPLLPILWHQEVKATNLFAQLHHIHLD